MVVSTVFPELVRRFAEAITQAVEAGEWEKWPPEDAAQFAAACQEIRQKVESFEERLRQTLAEGVDVATFKATVGSLLPRWETLAAEMAHAQGVAAEAGEVLAEFTPLVRAVAGVRDLFKNALAVMDSPRPPMDWERVHAAQAAYLKGETKPFHGTQEQNGK
jgi:hypothetical protein